MNDMLWQSQQLINQNQKEINANIVLALQGIVQGLTEILARLEKIEKATTNPGSFS